MGMYKSIYIDFRYIRTWVTVFYFEFNRIFGMIPLKTKDRWKVMLEENVIEVRASLGL